MSNPFGDIITEDFKNLYRNVINALLAQEALTLPCRLIYSGTKYTDCPNCDFNSITGKSNNTYTAGGPQPFARGICPYCGGLGKIPEESTEVLYLAVLWDYRKFINVAGESVKNPEGVIQTICSLDKITKLKKTKEIIVDTSIEPYVRHRFIRDGEPNPAGFGGSDYILTLWRRVT